MGLGPGKLEEVFDDLLFTFQPSARVGEGLERAGLVAGSQLLVSTRSGIPSELVEFNLIQAGGEVLCDKVRTGNPPPGGSTDTAQLHSAGSAHFSTMCALCTPERAECARCVWVCLE